MGRRLVALALSIAALGFGVAVFERIGFGTDPLSCMNLGLHRVTGISFGTLQMLVNVVLLVAVLRFDPGKIGLGTVMNMVCVGYIAEFFMAVFDRIPAMNALTMPARVLIFLPTMALFLVAVAFYIVVDMGLGPYDAVPMILADRARHMRFRAIRMCWDIGALTIGFVLGSTIGLTTLVTGFCLGPAIASISDRVRGWFA